MPFDPILGVGRNPKTIGTVQNIKLTETMGAGAGTNSTSITVTPCQAIFLTASIAPDSGAGVYAGVFLEVYINVDLVARFALPGTSGSGTWNISEIIPLSKLIDGASNTLNIVRGNTGGGAGTYFVTYNLNLYTILV